MDDVAAAADIHAADPAYADLVEAPTFAERTATDDDVEDFLRHVPLFAALPDDALQALVASVSWRHLPGGEYLFHQGDAADALSLVWSGRLQVMHEPNGSFVADADRVEEVISILGRGSWVGELSLLTGAPRSAGVKALRDSQLLQVSALAFNGLLEREPELALNIARVLARDVQQSHKTAAAPVPPNLLAVVPLGESLPIDRLVDRLQHTLGGPDAVTVLRTPPSSASSDDRPPGPAGPAEAVPIDPHDAGVRRWADQLDRLESTHPWVVLVADRPAADPAWAGFCVRSADRTLALVRGGKPPSWAIELLDRARCDLVFIGSSLNAARMTPSLEALRPRTHHHLPEGDAFDAAADRAARRAGGRATGVVFSGGGARGLAHLGVIEALLDADVRIDRVGGCSAGSFAAALFAMGKRPDEMRAICREELVDHHPFTDVGVPREGLIKGKRALAMLGRVFGEARIEELSISFFAVSADLATGELVIHRTGLLRDAIAASMSIPGVAPPIRRDGQLLVDGGLLDNLPVDVMADMHEGPVIAVDVMREFPMPDSTPTKGARVREIGPGIVSTIARSMVLGGWQRAQQNRRRADLLISPECDSIGMFDFDRMDDAVAAGRAAATDALARWSA